jgi:SAM-dependent methyltransferase
MRTLESNLPLSGIESATALRIRQKRLLRRFYTVAYEGFRQLPRKDLEAPWIEIGSGYGFGREIIPNLITTDISSDTNPDRILDARSMNFKTATVDSFLLLNSFHHISDVESFFKEAVKALRSNGWIWITDPYGSAMSRWIYRYIHHEPFDLEAEHWTFLANHPDDSNQALSQIVFERDRKQFESRFPELEIVSLRKHTPILYWMSGGVSRMWQAPQIFEESIIRLDRALTYASAFNASFWDVVLRRR